MSATEENVFDMDKAVDTLGADLGFETDDIADVPEGVDETLESEEIAEVSDPEESEEIVAEAPIEDDFPKSWPKEKKESWGKIPPEAREQIKLREKQMLDGLDQYKNDAQYGKSFKDIIAPYQKVIQESGVTETQAIQHLMNAHVKLTYGSKESRIAAYQELGRNLGLELTAPTEQGQQTTIDPKIASLESKLERFEREANERKMAEQRVVEEKTRAEVDEFAAKNPYFDEVAEDVAIYIKGGLSLEKAYERAVWANPVTRQKEQVRIQTESEKALKLKAAEDAKKSLKAKSSNINNRHTKSVPTEPKGKMFDDMEEQLAAIKNRH